MEKVIGYLQNNIYNDMFNVNREYISKKRVIYNLYGRERANKMVEVKELFKNTEEYINKEVTVGGWVRSIRDSKTFGFIVLNDGTFFQSLYRWFTMTK